MRFTTLKQDKALILLRNLIIVELFAYLAFLGLALAADWGEIYEEFVAANYIRFEVVEFTLLGFAQLVLILLVFAKSLRVDEKVEEIIKHGEHDKLEFKASLRWDVNRNQINRELEKAVMKTIAAFLNSDGGHLIIGIGNEGEFVGLNNDYNSLPRPDADGFENHFNNIFKAMLGIEFRRLVNLKFEKSGGHTICLVAVEKSGKPVYFKAGDNEQFYIRTGNATTPLKMSETATYIFSRWR